MIAAIRKHLVKRLLWMVGIWTLSVLALATVAGVFRMLMSAAGLTT